MPQFENFFVTGTIPVASKQVGRNKLHPGLLAAPEWGNFQRREAWQTLLVRKALVQQPYTLSETGLQNEKLTYSVGFSCKVRVCLISARNYRPS
jgi:hypothetical protein